MTSRPRRALHVIRTMNRGGVETWLMHVLRRSDPQLLQMDFLVHTDTPAAYDREIVERGSRLLRCRTSWRSPAYGCAVRSLVRQYGPYDAIHSHVHYFSGVLLALIRGLQVPTRIAHCHCDSFPRDLAAGWLRRRYIQAAKAGLERYATHWLAASEKAGRGLFGDQWRRDPRSQVLHCGIDLEPFRQPEDRECVRESLRVAADELVVGHVGRFEQQKNHPFLVEIAAEAARREPRLRLLLIGEGPARTLIEERVRALGIGSRTNFLGSRADVPRLLSAMDGFLFPSLCEGLPLTLLEAQAAGLPCLITDSISSETDVASGLLHRLPLQAGAQAWANKLVTILRNPKHNQPSGLAVLEKTDFNIQIALEGLYALYGV